MAGTLARAWRRVGPPLLAGSLLVTAGLGSEGCRRSRPQLQRGDAAVVLLTPPVPIPPGLLAVPEQEPSDPTREPPSLPLAGSPGLAVVGALSDEPGLDDEDVYALEIPGGPLAADAAPGVSDAARAVDAAAPSNRALSLEVNPAATLATVLELRDAAGGVLGSSSGEAGQKHGLPNVAIRPGGRYLVAVRRDRPRKAAAAAPTTRPSGSYALLVREVTLGAGDEREPNDSLETATALGPAHAAPEVAGYFGAPRDRDFYRVPIGEASESTVVSVFLTPPSAITASLAVYDRAGVKVQGARGRPGERVVLRSLAPASLAPGTADPGADPPSFYLSVQTEGAADLEHRYVLGVRSEPVPDSEREPNDQPIRATTVGAGAWSGYLGPGDVDFFRCEVGAGTELAVDLAPSRRPDLVLEVLMPGAGRPQRADAARRGQPERLLLPAAASGAALIRVQGRRATDADLEDPYTLTIELRPGGPDTIRPPAPSP
jgi:hypothetical protein